jgi:hypothetical protein
MHQGWVHSGVGGVVVVVFGLLLPCDRTGWQHWIAACDSIICVTFGGCCTRAMFATSFGLFA